MTGFREAIEVVGTAVDGTGLLIVVGAVLATVRFVARGQGGKPGA